MSVGSSKEDQTTTLLLLRSTRLPESSSEPEETPRFSVRESQMVEPEPLTRRSDPVGRRRRTPPESTSPADQTATPPE